MNLNKICPDCAAEYLPHIQTCADCGAVLVLHEELGRIQEEKKRLMEKIVENSIVVREGDLNWLSELRAVLIDSGISCTLDSDAGCNKGCCGDKWRLVVSSEDLERAQERIEEYFMELHPELRTSNELSKEGKCPACGSLVGANARECQDCGLMLIIEEEGCEGSPEPGSSCG